MANFGWSYPPGCSGTPYDEPAGPCDVCGLDVDSEACLCPECPECGTAGDPRCYDPPPSGHGMTRTEAQKIARAKADDDQRAEALAEERWRDEMDR